VPGKEVSHDVLVRDFGSTISMGGTAAVMNPAMNGRVSCAVDLVSYRWIMCSIRAIFVTVVFGSGDEGTISAP
jgi:hypothetical protein